MHGFEMSSKRMEHPEADYAGKHKCKKPRNMMGMVGIHDGHNIQPTPSVPTQHWQEPGAVHKMFVRMKSSRKQACIPFKLFVAVSVTNEFHLQVGKACLPCRQGKLRCSNGRPCTTCVNRQMAALCTDKSDSKEESPRSQAKDEDSKFSSAPADNRLDSPRRSAPTPTDRHRARPKSRGARPAAAAGPLFLGDGVLFGPAAADGLDDWRQAPHRQLQPLWDTGVSAAALRRILAWCVRARVCA